MEKFFLCILLRKKTSDLECSGASPDIMILHLKNRDLKDIIVRLHGLHGPRLLQKISAAPQNPGR